MKKITFIYPRSSSETDFSGKKTTIPPEGLCLLAAIVRERGYSPNIIDAEALSLSYDKVVELVKYHNPDYIGLTSATINIHSTAELATLLKKALPSIPIILGGAQVTVLPEETMEEFECFDVGVIGEGEITLVNLLNVYDQNKSLENIGGVVFRKKDKVIRTNPGSIVENLDSLPIPAWELLPNLKKYYRQSVARAERQPSMSIMTSRGCPGRCIFCVQNQKLRAYSAKKLIQIVKHLIKNYKIKSLEINDDNFVAFKDRLVEFCNMLTLEKINIAWSCMSRVNHVNPEMLKLMKKAGCKRIAYGIESGSQEILNFEKKGITLEQVKNAVIWTHEAGIKVTGYFILGHPNETKETINQTIKLALNLPFDDYLPSYMIPYPGSELYSMANKYGTFEKDWRKMYQWNVNFIPKGFTKEELEHYFKTSIRKFYLRPRIIKAYALRAINPEYTIDFIKEGLNALRYMLK